jgi:hypothetical protein
MRYADGHTPAPGDVVRIDGKYRGVVVACIDEGMYLPGQERWAYLKDGLVVDTDFGGLVHYTSEAVDEIVLVQRASAA